MIALLLLLFRTVIEALPQRDAFDVVGHLAQLFVDQNACYSYDILDLVFMLHANRQFCVVLAASITSKTFWRVDRLRNVVLVFSIYKLRLLRWIIYLGWLIVRIFYEPFGLGTAGTSALDRYRCLSLFDKHTILERGLLFGFVVIK